MTTTVTRRKFTADEYECMAEAGILHEDEHVELIEGDIIQMCAVGSRHAGCDDALDHRCSRGVGDRAIVRVQRPVRLSDGSEPEPDVVLLRYRPDFYRTAHPTPTDVLLLIEVADSSLAYDRDTKLPLHAAAGIPEVWIVNLDELRIEVYRSPKEGAYRATLLVEHDGTLAPLAFPDLTLRAQDILG